MRKFYCSIVLFFYFSIVIYLLLPSPKIPPLPESYKSTEPGDTGQIPGVVAAYYTNLSRRQVIDFYKKNFARSSLFGTSLITLRLNHPPEQAKEIIIDTIHSDFFEEIVYPLRESLFINGWTPQKDINYQKATEEPIFEFEGEGKRYQTKITLYLVSSSILSRLVIFHLSLLATFILIRLLKSVIASKWGIG